eukprot:jgi/Ulvmu1/7726/UM039_0032.1
MAHRSLRRFSVQSLCLWHETHQLVGDRRISLSIEKRLIHRYAHTCDSRHAWSVTTSWPMTCLPAKAYTPCWSFEQVRAFAIRRQRRRDEPKVPSIPSLSNLVDWAIDSDKVMVIDQDMKAVMPLGQAVNMAHGRNLNLVQVSAQNSQPVCKLLDFKQMQNDNREVHKRKHAEAAEKDKRLAKMKGVRLGWNIAQHDLDFKIRKIDEFLGKGKLVAVSTTYDHKPNKWQQQYPKAVEVAKTVWSHFEGKVHSWYDYSESGNKQVTVMYSSEPAPNTGKHTLLPWEPGSMLPPFLQAAQNETAQGAGHGSHSKSGHARGHSRR